MWSCRARLSCRPFMYSWAYSKLNTTPLITTDVVILHRKLFLSMQENSKQMTTYWFRHHPRQSMLKGNKLKWRKEMNKTFFNNNYIIQKRKLKLLQKLHKILIPWGLIKVYMYTMTELLDQIFKLFSYENRENIPYFLH